MPPIHVNEKDLIDYLAGIRNPPFVSEVSPEDLPGFHAALEEIAQVMGLEPAIAEARAKNQQKMGIPAAVQDTEEYKQLLRDWGFGSLVDGPSQTLGTERSFAEIVEDVMSQPHLPGFVERPYEGILEVMTVLQTRNGEMVGNGIIIEVRYDTNNGEVLTTVCTDAGNIATYNLAELEERFHPPKWVAKGFISKHVQNAVDRYFEQD